MEFGENLKKKITSIRQRVEDMKWEHPLPLLNLPKIASPIPLSVSGIHELNLSASNDDFCGVAMETISHSADMNTGWQLEVLCKPAGDSATWKNLTEVFPRGTVQIEQTSVVVKVPTEDITESALLRVVGFGTPESRKRMQAVAFGRKAPVLGKKWTINACLIDDDYNALKVMCEKELKKGNRLLVPPRPLRVSISGEKIKFTVDCLSEGGKLIDPETEVKDPGDVWDFWGKAHDVEQCSWNIIHEDKNKKYLHFQISVKQGEKSTILPILEYFKEEEVCGDLLTNNEQQILPVGVIKGARGPLHEKVLKGGGFGPIYIPYAVDYKEKLSEYLAARLSKEVAFDWRSLAKAFGICEAPETYPNVKCSPTKALLGLWTYSQAMIIAADLIRSVSKTLGGGDVLSLLQQDIPGAGEADVLLEWGRKSKTKQEASDLNKLEIQKDWKSRHFGHHDFITKTPVPL